MAFHRQKYWSGLPSPTPGDLPKPGIEPGSPALQADAFPSEPPGKPLARYLDRGRRARRKARPAGHRPAFDHHHHRRRVPARGPRPCRARDAWGPPVRRSTAARRSPPTPKDHPHIPPKRAEPSPTTSYTGTAAPHPADPVLRPRPPGPPTRARGPGTLLPPPPRAERTGSVAPSGQGHDRGERARDKTAARGVGRGGREQAPRLGGREEASGDRASGPEQRTTTG